LELSEKLCGLDGFQTQPDSRQIREVIDAHQKRFVLDPRGEKASIGRGKTITPAAPSFSGFRAPLMF